MKTTILIIVSVLINMNLIGQSSTVVWSSDVYYTEDSKNTLSIDVKNKITLHYKDSSDFATIYKVDVDRVICNQRNKYSLDILEPIVYHKHYTKNGKDIMMGYTNEGDDIIIVRRDDKKHVVIIKQAHGVDIRYVQ